MVGLQAWHKNKQLFCCIYCLAYILMPHNMIILYFVYLTSMPQIGLNFLHSTSVLSFCIDVVLALSITSATTGSDRAHPEIENGSSVQSPQQYGPVRQTWWRHQMETFSALLAIVRFTGPRWIPRTQKPSTRSFDVFFDLRLNKRLGKQSWGWWFETVPRPLWRHGNENYNTLIMDTRYLTLNELCVQIWVTPYHAILLYIALNLFYVVAFIQSSLVHVKLNLSHLRIKQFLRCVKWGSVSMPIPLRCWMNSIPYIEGKHFQPKKLIRMNCYWHLKHTFQQQQIFRACFKTWWYFAIPFMVWGKTKHHYP